VPVRNRRALLEALFDGLAAQTFTDYEVVVVDDGSHDGSGAVVEAEAGLGRPVLLITTHAVGAVAARGVGVTAASGDILAFTDSDCVPDAGWLAAGVAAIDAGADVAQGRTAPLRRPDALERSLAAGEESLYATCNVFYRRSAFEGAGGFDALAGSRLGFRPGTRLRGVGFGEDTLLGWAVRRSGRAAYVPDAVVAHQVLPADLGESLRRAWGAGAFPALVREVPELRRTLLVHGVFLESRSRAALYVAVVAAVVGRRRVARGALLVWAWRRWKDTSRRERSVRRRLAVFPIHLSLDVVRAAALVSGSVRARTPVL
jgi:glycosyltransferase involved in cell wall biosynthesis